ncbi:MAG: PDZ domain-containing protein [Opitutales bacterium]|nr:PDZ domain-containing protein [Opitutales bacterium]
MFAKFLCFEKIFAMFNRLLFIVFFASVGLFAKAQQQNFEQIFQERVKCSVVVKYTIELEEDRKQEYVVGTIVDDNGLVMLSPSVMLNSFRHDELKDFKVFFYGGDVDGYPAEYLGADSVSKINFIRIKNGLPKDRIPISKFKTAKLSRGDCVWGVGFYSDEMLFEPILMRSYVQDIGKRPLDMASTAEAVSASGGVVFNQNGDFVGWGYGVYVAQYNLYAADIKGLPVSLALPNSSDKIVLPNEINDILKYVPSNPAGDNHAWLGIINMSVLKRDVAKMMGIENHQAFLISDIIKDSPADKGGLKKGDIIVGINGKNFELIAGGDYALYNFSKQYVRLKKGDKIKLSVIRGADAPKDFEITLGESPKTIRQSQTKYFKRIGFSIREFLLDDAIELKAISKKIEQPVVKYVKPNSPAQSAMPSKLAVGDIIKEINSKPIKNYAQAVEELKKINDDASVKSLVILAEDFKETKVIRIKLD